MNEVLAFIVLGAGALGALGKIALWIRKMFKMVDRIEGLMAQTAEHVDRELTPNHGSSMKDQQNRMPGTIARLERKVDRLGEQVALVREVGEANGRHLDAHIEQSDLDRQRLADQGIDLTTEGTDT